MVLGLRADSRRSLADNVAELLLRRIRSLPDATRRVLQLASCVGSVFDVTLLATVLGQSVGTAAADLLPAINERLISPIGEAFNRLLADPGAQPTAPRGLIPCRFLHDRIQQTVYSMLSQEQRRSCRLKLGCLLLRHLSADERRPPTVRDHRSHQRRPRRSGRRGRAFAIRRAQPGSRQARPADNGLRRCAALHRTRAGLLPADAWAQHYELAFALSLAQLESACLARKPLDEIDHLARQLEEKTRSDVDRAKAATLRVDQLGARGRPEQALRMGLPLLKQLGLDLRVTDASLAMRESWEKIQRLLAGRSVAQAVAETPASSDPRHQAAIELFLKLGAPMYSLRPELLSLGSLESVRLCLQDGNVPGSGMCYAAAGKGVAHELEEFDAGCEMGEIGVELAKRWGAHVGQTRLVWGAFTRWLQHPLRENLQLFEQGFSECLDVGDIVAASQHSSTYAQTALHCGITLQSLEQGLKPLYEPLRGTDLELVHICELTQNFCHLLSRDGALDPAVLQEPDAFEQKTVQRIQQIPFPPGLHWYYLLRCRLLLLAGDAPAAVRNAALAVRYAPEGLFAARDLDYYHALALASACDEAEGDQLSIWQAQLAPLRERIARWAEVVLDDNYLHKATLVEAEVARLARDDDAADVLYERAIVLARHYGSRADEALASERAALHATKRELPEMAASHLRNACYCYRQWGASAKVEQLEAHFPELLESESEGEGSLVHDFGARSHEGGCSSPAALDLLSLLKASQALSAEMVVESLLRRLLRMTIENAGAERGVLLLEHEDSLMVHAVSGTASDEVRLLDPTPLEQSGLVSHGIVNYVVRMDEDLLLDDASSAEAFGADPYVVSRRPRSLLCARIIGRAKRVGVIYLENNMVSGAFGQQRLEMVRVLAAQAAISIQNARLYDSLTQHSEEIARLREQLQLENEYLREEVKTAQAFGNIVGSSAAIQKALRQVEMVAPTDASVLILGESGTGKELVAHAIHERSQRRKGPFISVNCASIPRELFESEFFGHVRGAFTGAVKERVGRFQLADSGTLLLDEVGEIPLELQGKLLRVLQEGTVERVGEGKPRSVDVRIVAATNRDLEAEVRAGRFRQDLYYRLSVFPITMAPLRDRQDDIPELALHFIDRSARRLRVPTPRLTRAHVEQLQRYDWPGNVRELQNVVERALIAAGVRGLHFDLPDATAAAAHAPAVAGAPVGPLGPQESGMTLLTYAELKRLERENVLRALELSGWKVSGEGGAAARLGTKPSTLTSRMKAMGIERPR
jgi:transcriptional regulator with GAF, ATPase, and Fis domain